MCVVVNMALLIHESRDIHIACELLLSKKNLGLTTQVVSQYNQLHLEYNCSPTMVTLQSDDLEISMCNGMYYHLASYGLSRTCSTNS